MKDAEKMIYFHLVILSFIKLASKKKKEKLGVEKRNFFLGAIFKGWLWNSPPKWIHMTYLKLNCNGEPFCLISKNNY